MSADARRKDPNDPFSHVIPGRPDIAPGGIDTPITAQQLLNPRRHADIGSSLWQTFNVIQENVIRGGLSAMGRDAQNRPRRVSTREVRGIDGDVKLNKALWQLAERMAELKA